MARERMVTRTIEVNTFEVMTVNVETAEVKVMDLAITGDLSGKDSLVELRKLYENSTIKLVHITSQTTEEVLYGMSETDFIRMAKIMPPRNANV